MKLRIMVITRKVARTKRYINKGKTATKNQKNKVETNVRNKKQGKTREIMRQPLGHARELHKHKLKRKVLLLNVKDLVLDGRKIAALAQELKVMGIDVDEVHGHITLHQLAEVVVLTKSIATSALPLDGLCDTTDGNTCVAAA